MKEFFTDILQTGTLTLPSKEGNYPVVILISGSETGSLAEYATIDQTFSPIALDEITNWVLKQVEN